MCDRSEEEEKRSERGCEINSCVTVGGGSSRNAAYVTVKLFYS